MPENNEPFYVVYFLKLNGTIKYCGITCDSDERKQANARKGTDEKGCQWGDAVFEVQNGGLSKPDARLIEGKYIRDYDLIDNGWNGINSAAREPGPLNYVVPKHEKIDRRKRPYRRRKPIYAGQNMLFGMPIFSPESDNERY